MRNHPQYINHVENRLIDQIDWQRHLEAEAAAWIADRAQRRFEERQALARLRTTAFREAR